MPGLMVERGSKGLRSYKLSRATSKITELASFFIAFEIEFELVAEAPAKQ
jgi:hypothetical protein